MSNPGSIFIQFICYFSCISGWEQSTVAANFKLRWWSTKWAFAEWTKWRNSAFGNCSRFIKSPSNCAKSNRTTKVCFWRIRWFSFYKFSRSNDFDPLPNCAIDPVKQKGQISRAHLLAKITLLINVSLTIAKFFASYFSGSLSIISSLVDSLVDITSGIVIWATSRAITKVCVYKSV